MQLGDELAAALRDDPSTLAAIADALSDRRMLADPMPRAAAFYALGVAETPDAQAFLVTVATRERASEFDRLHAIVALHGVVPLTSGAVHAVVALVAIPTECAACVRAATMAVATWAGRTNAPVEASAAFDRLLPELMSRDPVLGLAAVENHGGAVVEHWGRTMLDADAPDVRAAAAHALGTLPARQRWEILGPLLATERAPQILVPLTRALAAAIREGEAPADPELQASLRLLTADDPDVRGGAIELVGAEAATSPVARRALISRFREEPDAHLRRAIGQHVSASELATTR